MVRNSTRVWLAVVSLWIVLPTVLAAADRFAGERRPFFLYLTYFNVHGPLTVPETYCEGLSEDIGETRDLISERPAVAKRLLEELKAWNDAMPKVAW